MNWEQGIQARDALDWLWLPGTLVRVQPAAPGSMVRPMRPGARGALLACPDDDGIAFRIVTPDPDALTEGGWIPDLDDPSGATLGCLLEMVRRRFGDRSIYVFLSRSVAAWVVSGKRAAMVESYLGEVDALIAALTVNMRSLDDPGSPF